MQVSRNQFVLIAVLSFLFCSGIITYGQGNEEEKTLYDRLGGIHAIAAVVDDFVERIWVNEVMNQNPKNKQAMGISKPALKYLATELTCMVTGGPQKYTGRPLKETHQPLNISEKEWEAMVGEFIATLDHFNVPEKERAELLQIIGGAKGDIVMASAHK